MTVNSAMVKVAEWSDQHRFVPIRVAPERTGAPTKIEFERNRTYVVTTIIEEPYIMLKKIKPGDIVDGKDQYEGYCKDLADLLAQKLGINCKYYLRRYYNSWRKFRLLCEHSSARSRAAFGKFPCRIS